jgi:hypothetical protein
MTENRSTSPWLYIGLGCLLAVVLLVATVVGLGWLGIRQAQRFAEEIRDPEARGAKVQEALGYEEPPPGYHPAMSFSMPMLMRMAMLTDQPPGPDGEPDFGSRTFVFLDVRDFGDDHQEVRDYLQGLGERPRMFDRTNLSVGTQRDLGSLRPEPVARGVFEQEGVTYYWSAHEVELHGREGRRPGIETLVLVECLQPARRVRLGVWAVALEPDEQDDLLGTPADEGALRSFFGHLRLCP